MADYLINLPYIVLMISLELMKSSVVRKAGDRSMYALQTIVYAGIWKI